MSIPSVGSSGVQKTPSSDTVDNSSQTNATQDTSQPKSEPLSDSAKGQILQESNISGQSRRSQLDTALEKGTSTQTDSLKAKEAPDAKGGPAFPTNADEMAKTSNEDMLKLAQQPGGEEKLKQLATDFKKDGLTPDEIKQTERIDSATFRPGAGLTLHGKPEDQQTFIQMTRRTMLESPSFRQRMQSINHDPHPLHHTEIEVSRGKGDDKDSTRLSTFSEFRGGRQQVDLNDLEKLPVKPDPSNPEGITQGSVLVHEYAEARRGTLTPKPAGKNVDPMKLYEPAHEEAIKAENEYRKDIGQSSQRLMPPKDVTRTADSITVHYDDGHSEKLQFKKGLLEKTTVIPKK
jgi:hypothetical protein